MRVISSIMFCLHVCLCPLAEVRRRCPIPRNWSFLCVCSCSCPQKSEVWWSSEVEVTGSWELLGVDTQNITQILSALNPWTISPTQFLFFNKVGSHYRIALYSSRLVLNLRSSCHNLSRCEPGKVLFKHFQSPGQRWWAGYLEWSRSHHYRHIWIHNMSTHGCTHNAHMNTRTTKHFREMQENISNLRKRKILPAILRFHQISFYRRKSQ